MTLVLTCIDSLHRRGTGQWQAEYPRLVDALVTTAVFARVVPGPLAGDHGHGHQDDLRPGPTVDTLVIALLSSTRSRGSAGMA